jgi:peptidyl-prolyl cis-trans isomerase SurA
MFKHIFIHTITSFLLLGMLAHAQLLNPQIPIDGYAALVNDRVITVGDVMATVQPIERQLKATYAGEELEEKMLDAYQDARNALVERSLILEEFKKMEGNLPERVVDNRLNDIISERFDDDRTAFLKALSDEGVTLEEWRNQVRDQLVITILRRQEIVDRIVISPSAVRNLYDERQKEYQVPEKVKLRMIVLNKGTTPEDMEVKRTEAQQILDRLSAGEDFEAVAKEVSEGSKASRGGDWGWIEPTILQEDLAQAAAALEAGQYSSVVNLEEEIYILFIEARKNASVISFNEVREDLDRELRQAEGKKLEQEWMARLKSKHFVNIY